MNKYEAMLIVKAEHSDKEKDTLFKQLDEVFSKNAATIISSGVWSEKRKLAYPIKKQTEGVYYLIVFESEPNAIAKMRHMLSLNDSVLRASILKP